jgi:microcin C transport system substrate-binding protein
MLGLTRMRAFIVCLLGCFALWSTAYAEDEIYSGHGVAMHGEPKYGANFSHLEYANPDAPKGGTIHLAQIGTYDSFNPFIIKGVPAAAIGLLYETLMESTADEAFTSYGLIAERIEFPADRSWVLFTLRAEARWHDGTPITTADVVFSFDILKTQGLPHYSQYYANVVRAEALDERRVKFVFDELSNRELPLIMGQLAVLPKAYYDEHPFDRSSLEVPLGSGPYTIEAFEPGRSVTYKRLDDYWGRDLPINRGRWNFDRVRYDYYRDQTVAIEALKAHEYDFRAENSAKEWATAYTGPQFVNGLAVRQELAHELPTGLQGFVYNMRRPMFRDRRVREALTHTFDFEWANRTLFYGTYVRTRSYFSNTELASSGLPSPAELALLEPHRTQLTPELFTEEFRPPETDGSGSIRRNLRAAAKLLDDAGWRLVDGARRDPETGAPMVIEFLLVLGSQSSERIVAPIIQNMAKLGIEGQIRFVDTSQYQNRVDDYDFDIVSEGFAQSLSPGNEQREFWGTVAADLPGSRNLIGIKDPVVDALIEQVIQAPDRLSLIDATRALDRVLLWGHYVIPQFHIRSFRLVYWNKFSRPAVSAKYSLGVLATWWVDPEKAQALAAQEGRDAE